jgi:flagellar biosynthesis protein FlhF
MTHQVFRGSTLEEARRAAEAALGQGAVVLTTRKVPQKGLGRLLGRKDVEIAAMAAEPDPEPPPPPPPAPVRRGPFSDAALGVDAKTASAAELAALRSELRSEIRLVQGLVARKSALSPAIEGELAALRDALERLSEMPELARNGRTPKLLRVAGLEGRAQNTLAKTLRGRDDASPEELRDALADLVRVAQWPLADERATIVALVGPSGVGKTTTAAKLAGQAVAAGRSVTFICCDAYRVGAVEQLGRYAKLLQARFEVAATPGELGRALANAATDLVIIDTAGHPPTKPDSVEAAIGNVRSAAPSRGRWARHVLLCLPASVRAADADRFAKAFAPCNPTALAITKLDETASPAGLIHGSVASKLPVSVLCFGQRVPEDIARATSGAILDQLVPPGGARWREAS